MEMQVREKIYKKIMYIEEKNGNNENGNKKWKKSKIVIDKLLPV